MGALGVPEGVKLGAYETYGRVFMEPEIYGAPIHEAKKHGRSTVTHLHQTGVARINAPDAAGLRVGMLTHSSRSSSTGFPPAALRA